MAITLPAYLEINTFVGEGEEGCFQIELCCLLSGWKNCIHVSSHVSTRLWKTSSLSLYHWQYSQHLLTVCPIWPRSSKRSTHVAEARRIPSLLEIMSWVVPYEIPKCLASFSKVTLLSPYVFLNFSHFLFICNSQWHVSMLIIFVGCFSTVLKAFHPFWKQHSIHMSP